MQDWIERGRDVLAIEIEGLEAVRDALDQSFTKAVQLLGRCRGRVVVTGIGKSGLVGRKLAATLSSTGTPAFFLHAVEGAHGDLGSIREEDVAIAISYSGKSDELNAIIPTLKSLGVAVIAMTGNLDSPLAALGDVVLSTCIPREACPMNLAPTSSTTATLALGDALAVCLMDLKQFTPMDFKRFHPAGALGQHLALSVGDIMHHKDLPVVKVDASTKDVLTILDASRLGAVMVLSEQKHLAGILTDGDVRRAVVTGALNPDKHVAEIMTAAPVSVFIEQSAAEALDIMEHKSITVLPVLDRQGDLVGIIHLHDLLGKGTVKFAG